MANPSDLIEQVTHLSQRNLTLSPSELNEAYRFVVALQTVSAHKAKRIVDQSDIRPILSCYMSDGWSVFVQDDISRNIGETGITVRASGRFRHEFLIERQIVRQARPSGATDLAIVSPTIKSLRHGKGAWQMFASAADRHINPRVRGHTGIAMNVYLFDGALFHSTIPKLKALHRLWYIQNIGEIADASELEELQNKEITCGMACKIHAGHNALKWGISVISSDEITDNGQMTIRSVLNGMSAVHSTTDLWLVGNITFDRKDLSRDSRGFFWRHFEVPEKLLDLFVDLDPWWDYDLALLAISDDAEKDPELLSKLAIVILVSRRILQWSKTRWCRSGKAGRLLVRSFGTGLDSHVQYVINDKSFSNAYIGGYVEFATDEVRRMFAVLAFAAKPFERFVLQMLIDDRLLLHFTQYHAEVLGCIREILDMPSFMWGRVASVVRMTADDLFHDVCMVMCVSYWYFTRDVLVAVDELPFSLCIGDIAANIASLSDTIATPSNAYLRQIKLMIRGGVPELSVLQSLELLRNMPCSTTLAEQGLSHGAFLMKSHGRYGENSLRVRSSLQASRLLVRRDLLPGVKRINLKLASLRKRQPQKTNGTCMYFRDNVRHVLRHHSQRNKRARLQATRECFASSGRAYKTLSSQQRTRLSKRARAFAAKSRRVIFAEMVKLNIEKRALIRAHQEKIESKGKPNHIAQCRLIDGELQSACDLYQSLAYQSLRLNDSSDAFGEAPLPPSVQEQEIIEAVADEFFAGPTADAPWWCRSIARNRESFAGAALGLSEDNDEFWLLLFAKKNPLESTWLQLRRRPHVLDLTEARCGGFDQVVHGVDRRVYDWYPPVVKIEADMPFPRDDCELFVREGCRFHGEVVAAPHAAIPLEHILVAALCPTTETVTKEKRKRPTVAERDDIFKEHPWLSKDDLPGGGKSKPRRRAERRDKRCVSDTASSESSASDQEEEGQPVLVDDAVNGEEVGNPMEELAIIRDELRWEEEDPYFYVRVMGGRWTMKNRGVVANSVGGFARSEVLPWCDLYNFPKQCSHAFMRFGGREVATKLTHEYCRRGNFFYKFYVDALGDEYEYTSDIINSYVESEEWLDFVCGLDIHSHAFGAAALIRTVAPVIGRP